MGSGLILAGLGKGISDAGTTYGNMMFKVAEGEIADQRSLLKAQALERFKEQMKEEAEQRDAAKAIEVEKRATTIGQDRTERQLTAETGKLTANAGKIAGDSPALSEEEMRAHLESLSPAQRNLISQTGLIGRATTRNEDRFQAAEDTVQAARELGASSTLLKSYQDTKKSVLDAIKEENREKRDQQRHEEVLAQNERLGKQFETTSRISQQNADANTTRANRPTGTDPNKPATTADLQRQINAAKDDIAIELGVPKNDVNGAIATIKKRAEAGDAKAKTKLDAIQPFLTELQDANERMRAFKRPASEGSGAGSSGKGGDNGIVNSGSRPPISSFKR